MTSAYGMLLVSDKLFKFHILGRVYHRAISTHGRLCFWVFFFFFALLVGAQWGLQLRGGHLDRGGLTA